MKRALHFATAITVLLMSFVNALALLLLLWNVAVLIQVGNVLLYFWSTVWLEKRQFAGFVTLSLASLAIILSFRGAHLLLSGGRTEPIERLRRIA
jgi:hypothetical protein